MAKSVESEQLHLGVVHPWDCDVMGHMTVRRYAAAFDDASYHLLALATGEAPMDPTAARGWVDVASTYEYLAELKAGDLFEIVGNVVRVGTKSMSAHYELRRRDDATLRAKFAQTMARFDLQSRQAVEIEPAMRDRLTALARGPAI